MTTSRARGWVLLLVGLVVATVVLTLSDRDRAGSVEPLHPRNPGEEGTQALARVLADEGVPVDVVESGSALARSTVDGDTLLVVSSTGELGDASYPGLRRALDAAGTTVLLAPPPAALEGLDLPVEARGDLPGPVEAECDLALADGLTLAAGGRTYRPDDAAREGSSTCFRTGPGAELPGLLVTVGDVHVLGAPAALTNDLVLEDDDAALGLRLLGQRSRVLWYDATAADLRPGDARADSSSLGAALPDWVRPGGLLLLLAATLALLWQGRRFGPLVVEPLPVVVRADETARSRGLLYQASRDRAHAAAALRADAGSAWRHHLGLPPSAPLEEVLDRAAADPDAPAAPTLRALLTDAPVPDDKALVRLAADLARTTPTGSAGSASRKDAP